MSVLVRRLIDPENSYNYYVFFEQGHLNQPIMLLDQAEFDAIEEAFDREVYSGKDKKGKD